MPLYSASSSFAPALVPNQNPAIVTSFGPCRLAGFEVVTATTGQYVNGIALVSGTVVSGSVASGSVVSTWLTFEYVATRDTARERQRQRGQSRRRQHGRGRAAITGLGQGGRDVPSWHDATPVRGADGTVRLVPAEAAAHDPTLEWQWTKQQATLAFKNPKKDALFYFELDSPGKDLHGTQQVALVLGGQTVQTLTVEPDVRKLNKITLPGNLMGDAELTELQITVDKTFVPATVTNGASKDPRELGVRVFHAFVDPR